MSEYDELIERMSRMVSSLNPKNLGASTVLEAATAIRTLLRERDEARALLAYVLDTHAPLGNDGDDANVKAKAALAGGEK